MPIINGQPVIYYDGYTLPQDAAALADVPVNPNVNYAGYNLPEQAIKPTPYVIDPSNNPSGLTIGNVVFPASTQIIPKGDKIIPESQIIDGVTVFQHVSRKATELDFEVLLWENGSNVRFPQERINAIWTNLFIPNSVQPVINTWLNNLGISQLIIKSISPKPRVGSTNVTLKIKAYENQVGQTLIIL